MIDIESIEFLDAQVHENIAAIPIVTPNNYKFDLITLKKGFELGLVEVKECEHSTVNTLIVKNNAVTPLLLVDGEEIVGGDQNRIVNATILIAPQSESKIPVNCSEQGRWGYKHEFKQSEHIANYRTRSAKEMARRNHSNVQGAVWESIRCLENNRNFHSPTSAMSESYENSKIDLNQIIPHFKAEDSQNGVVILIDGEIKGFEILSNSEIYKEYHKKILKSYLIDIDINDSVFTINKDEIGNLIKSTLECEYTPKSRNGLEEAFEFEDANGFGSVYTYEDEIIHLSYFKNSGDGETSNKPHLINEGIIF